MNKLCVLYLGYMAKYVVRVYDKEHYAYIEKNCVRDSFVSLSNLLTNACNDVRKCN